MTNNKQQTAVEWLQSIELERDLTLADWALAKEMEKEQIMNAFDECGNWQDKYTDSEHYYNKNYGGNKQC
jgi:hypothetical protein